MTNTLNRINRVKNIMVGVFVATMLALLAGVIVYAEQTFADTAYQQSRQAEQAGTAEQDSIEVERPADASPDASIDGETVADVRRATYQLYMRVSPPGRTTTQTLAFCTVSFYARDEDEQGRQPGLYGTTAGHCLDTYSVIRERLNRSSWGVQFDLAVAADKSRTRFVTVEPVDHGLKQWREWLTADDEGRQKRLRPDTDDVDDWGVIRAPADAGLNVLPGIARPGSLGTAEPVWTTGYAWALGKMWMGGQATPDYRMPGATYDHYTAVDVAGAPGLSGAPVVDANGQQVGVLVAGFLGSDLTLVTPAQRIDFVRADDRQSGSSDYRDRWDYVYETRTEQNVPSFGYDQLTGATGIDLPVDAERVYNRVHDMLSKHLTAQQNKE